MKLKDLNTPFDAAAYINSLRLLFNMDSADMSDYGVDL